MKVPLEAWAPITRAGAALLFSFGLGGLFLVTIGEMPTRDTATSVLFLLAAQGVWRLAPWMSKPRKALPKTKPAKDATPQSESKATSS